MKEHVWIESRGKRLSAMLHQPDQRETTAIVIMCHGFTGEKVGGGQRYLQLANAMEGAGFAVIRFEYAGSGESEGTFAEDTSVSGWKEDVHNVIEWTVGQPAYCESSIFLLGHSLGGCISLTYEDTEKRIAGRIALAPEVEPAVNYRERIIGPELWEKSLAGETISHFYGSSYTLQPQLVQDLAAKKHTALTACHSYDCPLLLVHGTADTAIPYASTQQLAETYQGPVQLELIEDADHGFSRHLDVVKELLIEWLHTHA
ncbi:alpha/beta fold hydrolase [Brevibacillus fluminis]|uniref:Alpha/beta fold hydrolase n=1 Tax=Brevibacillus fluminis TaxID=511487 RepID=A0A3M8D8Z5_9BACL|nr:alpha/beta fold hydrolase [Brevibacillus fluminis]RNB84600.1 alpha/beta fold hydrolase [Brevibacillus fluminis]